MPSGLLRRPPGRGEILGRMEPGERRRLLLRSDFKGFLHLSGHLAALAVTGSLIAMEVPGWPLLMLPHGILLTFLFCLLHESVHGTPFRTAWLNKASAWGVGLVIVLPPRWFHHFHMAHHRYTHDPARDPELARPVPRSRAGLAWHIAGGAYSTRQVRLLSANAAGRNRDAFIPSPARSAVAREARLFLLIYGAAAAVSVYFATTALLWLWVFPVMLGQPFLRLYLLTEHTGCPHVPEMLQNTRTTFTNPLVRFFAWNMPYHVEHHVYPAVPFHKLPAFHEILRDDLTVTADGYPAAARAALSSALRGEA